MSEFTPRDALHLVERLAAGLGIPTPRVVFNDAKISRACFSATKLAAGEPVTLRMSRTDWHGLEVATLHEVAHAVRAHAVFAASGGKTTRHGHDRAFYLALRRVIAIWSGTEAEDALRRYHWHTEYWTLWDLAHRDGLTERQWFLHERRSARAAGNAAPVARLVRAGQHVEFDSKKLHGRQRGVVVSAYAGCRAKVKLADGRTWYVPQAWLRVVDGASERLS